MSILTYATGIGQLIKGESSASGADNRNTDYVQESIQGSLLDVEEDRVLTLPTIPDTFYMSFGTYLSTAFPTEDLWTIGDGTTNLLMFGSTSSADGYIQWYDGTEYVTIFNTSDYEDIDSANNELRWDIEYIYGDSSTGSINIYVDRVLLLEYSADTSVSGVDLTQVLFGEFTYNSISYNQNYISAFFIADEVTKYITAYQLVLSGDGTYHTDFNGSYEYLNNLGATGDQESVTATTLGDQQTYTLDTSPFDGVAGGTIVGIGVHARGKVQEALQGDQVRIMASTSTDDEYSEYFTLEERIEPFQTIFDNAPDGSAWDLDNIDNWEFGFEVTASD